MDLAKTIRAAQAWTREAPPGKMSAIEWQVKLDLAYTRSVVINSREHLTEWVPREGSCWSIARRSVSHRWNNYGSMILIRLKGKWEKF